MFRSALIFTGLVFSSTAVCAENAPSAAPFELATAEEEKAAVQWLSQVGHAFDLSSLSSSDLAPLVDRLAKARIVGIGEATHGAHEDQTFKVELIKALIQTGKFNTMLLEANRDAAAGFDRYVREGVGDPVALMKSGSFFRIWKNDEFASLLIWMRAWNSVSDKKVRIIGIDNQDAGRDADFALSFIERFDQAKSKEIRKAIGTMIPKQGNAFPRFPDWFKSTPKDDFDRAVAQVAVIKSWFDAAPEKARTDAGFADAYSAARTAGQAFNIYEYERPDADKSKMDAAYFARRDRFMAENAMARLSDNESAVFWAHDLHVIDELPPMAADVGFVTIGSEIEAKLKDDYTTIGFTWSKGAFWATAYTSPNGLDDKPNDKIQVLPNDRAGELGSVFNKTDARAMWVAIDERPQSDLLDSWIRRPYWRGYAGWGLSLENWQIFNPETGDMPLAVGTGHDVLVWFRNITPSHRWPTVP